MSTILEIWRERGGGWLHNRIRTNIYWRDMVMTFTELIESSDLYSGVVELETKDDLGMLVGYVEVLYLSPLALQDMALVSWN